MTRTIYRAKAVAKAVSAELILVVGIVVLLALVAMPAKAAMNEEGASLFEYRADTGSVFHLQAVYAADEDKKPEAATAQNEAGTSSKDVMLKGTYVAPVSKKDNVDMYMKGGVGVTATETNTYSADDKTSIKPAAKVGVGLNYKF